MANRDYRPIPHLTPKSTDRFFSKIQVNGPDECWPWLGTPNKAGYGRFYPTGPEGFIASRVALALSTGIYDSQLGSLHSCDNPPCCNPAHLRWGTRLENMRDMVKRGRISCKNRKASGSWFAATIRRWLAEIQHGYCGSCHTAAPLAKMKHKKRCRRCLNKVRSENRKRNRRSRKRGR